MQELKAGDVVELKSGGPKMTLKHIDEFGSAYCQWFAGADIKGSSFDLPSLVKI
jgi:uncharacterized protein YodC (DUF2158 family)